MVVGDDLPIAMKEQEYRLVLSRFVPSATEFNVAINWDRKLLVAVASYGAGFGVVI